MNVEQILERNLRSEGGTMFVSEEQVEDLAKFLKKIFKWQPSKRYSARQLL